MTNTLRAEGSSDENGGYLRVDSATSIEDMARDIASKISTLPLHERIDALNRARSIIAEASPFQEEPVDFVAWVPAGEVAANDYNPNIVARPEMKLLELSIRADGYTQPIVAYRMDDGYEVVDGFHRHKVGRESPAIQKRIHGHLPIATIKTERAGRTDRMAATVRHNRARGKHTIDGMSDIVRDLVRRNWSDARIAKELGMDADEVLRLKQITGLGELFADHAYSEAWEAVSDDGHRLPEDHCD